MKINLSAFTLIELMIVIAILGVLATLISGNFITSLKKGRDARRKTDLEQIQRALEMYYEDNKAYPAIISYTGGQLKHPSIDKTYMQKVPDDPKSGCDYFYSPVTIDGQVGSTVIGYKLYSYLENSLDLGPGVAKSDGVQSTYNGTTCGTCRACRYGISSSDQTL